MTLKWLRVSDKACNDLALGTAKEITSLPGFIASSGAAGSYRCVHD
jgi:hypothetical protein